MIRLLWIKIKRAYSLIQFKGHCNNNSQVNNNEKKYLLKNVLNICFLIKNKIKLKLFVKINLLSHSQYFM